MGLCQGTKHRHPRGCWWKTHGGCGAPTQGGLNKMVFRNVQQRARIYSQKLWRSQATLQSVYQRSRGWLRCGVLSKEVNLHPECFSNFRGYKHLSPATVWFVGAVSVQIAADERDTDFYLVQVSCRTLHFSLQLSSPSAATSCLLSSRISSDLAMTSAFSHTPHQCFLKSHGPGKTRALLDSPAPAAPRQSRDSWGQSLLFPGDVADPAAAC